MEILIFSSKSAYSGRPVGGAEYSLRLLAETLAGRGHSVVYLTRTGARLARGRSRTIDGVKVMFLPRLRLPWGRVSTIRAINLFLDFCALLLFFVGSRGRQTEVVHTYATLPDTHSVLWARRVLRSRFVAVQRLAGLFWYEQSKKDSRAKKRVEWTLSNVDCLNFISSGLEAMFDRIRAEEGFAVSPKARLTADIGVSPSLFEEDRRPAVRTVVMVARFIDRAKRHDLVIRALETEGLGDVTLHLAGEGPTRERWMQYCADRPGLGSRIVFHGHLSRSAVKSLVSRSTLFCLATDYEGLSKAVIEAMALGTPICVSDVPPLNTYVRDGENGFLAENSVEGWSQRLSELMNSEQDLAHASANGREFAKRFYDPEKQVLLYERLFERLCKNAG